MYVFGFRCVGYKFNNAGPCPIKSATPCDEICAEMGVVEVELCAYSEILEEYREFGNSCQLDIYNCRNPVEGTHVNIIRLHLF